MSGLTVPQQQQSSGKTITRSGSTSSLRPQLEHEDDLVPVSRSRRNSESNSGSGAHATSAPSAGAPGSAAAKAGLVPLPSGPIQASAENAALTSREDWSEPDQMKVADGQHAAMSIYVGKNKKPFHVNTSALMEKSPYFKRMLANEASKAASVEQTSFEDIDEFGMALFSHWLGNQGHLNGPHDFHSLAHYLSLYVLAKKFEIESLENQTMDLVRHYYAEQNMTAPAYRLEYMYTYTHGPNHMRHFLVSTAAFRCLEETSQADLSAHPMLHATFYAPGSNISDSIKAVLAKNPEMAIDFIEELHVHEQTPKCKVHRQEPWQSDGPADEKPADKKPEEPKKDEPKKDDAKKPEPPKPAAPGGPVAPVDPKKPEPPKPSDAKKPEDPPKKADQPKPEDHPDARKSAPSHHRHEHSTAHSSHVFKPPYRSETQRIQWEKTERALAKNDESPMKRFVDKVKDKLHHKKPDEAKPDDKKPDAPKPDEKKPDAPKPDAPKPDAAKK